MPCPGDRRASLPTIRLLQIHSAPHQPPQIRRMPHNKRCVNCDKESIAGHGNVCTKFQTFVCNTCKSAHQSFSHRCKSISLSNWTHTEVNHLSDLAGGGNANARLTWLGKLQGQLTLRPDDPLDKVKEFVNDAYNHNRYWKEKETTGTSSPVAATERPGRVSSGLESVAFTQPQQQREGILSTITTEFPHARANTAPTPVAAPVTDFLDFFADFAQATPPSVNPSHHLPNASHGTAWPPSGDAGDFAFVSQTSKCNSNSGIVSSAAPRTSSSFSPLPTGPARQADDCKNFDAFMAAPHVPGDSTALVTPAVMPASNFCDSTNGSAFGFMSSGPSTTPHHNDFCDFTAASAPHYPTGSQHPLTCTAPPPRPAPPAMRLTRPLIEDPFAVLAPQQQPSSSSASSSPYMPSQQPRPRGPMPAFAMVMMGSGGGSLRANRAAGHDAGCGFGGKPYLPSHMTTQPPPRPSDPQMPMMTMTGAAAASSPPQGFMYSQGMVDGPRPRIPVYGQQQQQQYLSQAPDPFAGLDWRK